MDETNQKWIEAAKIFTKNPKAKIKCPECSVGELISRDEMVKDQNKVDRYLICNHCGKWNVITIPLNRDVPE